MLPEFYLLMYIDNKSIYSNFKLNQNEIRRKYNEKLRQQLSRHGKKYRCNLDILRHVEITNLRLQLTLATMQPACDTNHFPRSLLDHFYITRTGNRILLSGVTNGVPCAVKIVRGNKKLLYPEGFCIKRASIRENYCARSSRVSSGGCVRRGYTRDTIVIRCSGKVKSAAGKIAAPWFY